MFLLYVSFVQMIFCSSALYQGVFGYYYLSHIKHDLGLAIEDPAERLWLVLLGLLLIHTPLGQLPVSRGQTANVLLFLLCLGRQFRQFP